VCHVRLLIELQLETLQERRRIQRLTFMYKILNGQVAVPDELIVNARNKLSQHVVAVVDAPSVNSFKNI